jgi:GNAT superfamily N-acetyltransferase
MTIEEREELEERARVLDSLEAEAILDACRAAPADFRLEHGMNHAALPFGIGVALRSIEASVFNRCLFPRPDVVDDADLRAAETWLRENANAARALDLPVMPTSTIVAVAERAGWRRGSAGLVQFGRGPDPLPVLPACALELVEIDASRAADFARLLQECFGLPRDHRALFLPLVGRPGWRIHAACDDGRPVACGAMFVMGRGAWLGMAATHPAYRSRGAQSALLARRLADGIALGVGLFAVAADRPAADDGPGHSFRNILRAGFGVSHERCYFQRP